MFKSLKGKTAIITGASRKKGIGAAIAQKFADHGANLLLASWPTYDQEMPWGGSENEVSEIASEIQRSGVQCATVAVDFTKPGSSANLFSEALRVFGAVDILVNNAVCDIEADIFSVSEELLQRHLDVNLIANVMLSAEFIRAFKKENGGRIINMTSGQSLAPMPMSIPYVVSKSAIEGLTLSLSATAGTKGITINAIDPGPTDTGWMSHELRQSLNQQSPFGRVGLPTDAANLAAFLASDEGGWITGQVLRSRGGL